MTNIIEMKDIHKFYKNGNETLEALKGISLSLKKGELLAIMGSSGSGKSTLLHIIGAMDVADKGEIYLNGILEKNYGTEPRATKIRYENIGFIFQIKTLIFIELDFMIKIINFNFFLSMKNRPLII